jgi:hypothetical protein
LKRAENWPIKLADALVRARRRPFVWGQHDCCLFVADVVKAMTGMDMGADIRGRYDSREGAAALIAQTTGGGGFDALAALYADRYGFAEVAPGFAWRGDVALTDADLGPTLGIIIDSSVGHLAPGGLTFLPRALVRRAWRV